MPTVIEQSNLPVIAGQEIDIKGVLNPEEALADALECGRVCEFSRMRQFQEYSGYFLSDDMLWRYEFLKKVGFGGMSMRFPGQVAAREGVPDGCMDTLDKFKTVFHPEDNDIWIKSPDELAEFLTKIYSQFGPRYKNFKVSAQVQIVDQNDQPITGLYSIKTNHIDNLTIDDTPHDFFSIEEQVVSLGNKLFTRLNSTNDEFADFLSHHRRAQGTIRTKAVNIQIT